MRRVQNLKSYAIDSPAALAPGEIAEVENSTDIDRLVEARIIGDVDEQGQSPAKPAAPAADSTTDDTPEASQHRRPKKA